MNLITYVLSGAAVIAGLSVAIWSFIDTRKRFYEDYINRKQK
jgi:hypothetical protein